MTAPESRYRELAAFIEQSARRIASQSESVRFDDAGMSETVRWAAT